MKNLNINRLIQVLKWIFTAEKKRLIRSVASIAIVAFLTTLVTTRMLWRGDYNSLYPEYEMRQVSSICLVLIVFWLLVSATRICFNMQKKNDIINYAMLPATKLEKFVANWVHQVLGTIVISFIGIFLADICQAVLSLILYGSAYSLTANVLIDMYSPFRYESVQTCINIVLAALFLHSTCILGGTMFRKYPTLITAALWFAIPMCIGTMVSIGAAGLFNAINNSGYVIDVEWLLPKTVTNILSQISMIAITALVYWFAYRKFTRIQVINNRFTN